MQAETGTPLTEPAPGAHSSSGRVGGRPTAHRVLWVVIALAVLALDQLTKWWAQSGLVAGRPRRLVGSVLELDLTHNAGAAFSIGTGNTVVLSVLAIVIVVLAVRAARRIASLGWSIAIGLLLGGALGNLTDRLFRAPGPLRGHVVDFLQLPHWPVFNLADTSICCAVALFVVLTVLGVRLDGSREWDRHDESGPESTRS